jgi:cytoskeletal protein RodZ
MPRRQFERLGLALLLVVGCVVFGDRSLIKDAQAQQQSAPPSPPPPAQSPVVNPSNPNTVPQPSYTPMTPSTQSTAPSTRNTAPSSELAPGHEKTPSTTTRSERTSVAKARPIHHLRRSRSTLVTYSCNHLGCVRTYAWAFPCQYYSRYCYP